MRFRFFAALGWTILIAAICWTPRAVVEEVGEEAGFLGLPHFDKLVHMGIFAVFAFLWLAASRPPRRFAAVAIGGLILAVVTELGQLVPWVNRAAGLDDAAFDVLGVLVGGLAFRLLAPWMVRRSSRLTAQAGPEPEAA